MVRRSFAGSFWSRGFVSTERRAEYAATREDSSATQGKFAISPSGAEMAIDAALEETGMDGHQVIVRWP